MFWRVERSAPRCYNYLSAAGWGAGPRLKHVNHKWLIRLLAIAGIIGPIAFWLISSLLAASQPGYSSITHTLSKLVFVPGGWVQIIGFCLLGYLLILFAGGLYSGVEARPGLKLGILAIFFIGLGVLFVGLFPTDLIDGTFSLRGTIHLDAAKSVGALFPIACALVVPSLRRDQRWRGFDMFTVASGALVLILSIFWVSVSSHWGLADRVGLYERLYFGVAILWVEVMSVRLLVLPALHR